MQFPRARPFRGTSPGPGPGPGPDPSILTGQFVIQTRNPFAFDLKPDGKPMYPEAKPDRFFMAELDSVWKVHGEAEAQRILDDYKALGCNHVTAGTPKDIGYHGHCPSMDWLSDPDGYADFLEWKKRNGVTFTLFLIPDFAPYYNGEHADFGWDAIERDLTPFYQHPRIQALTTRTALIWEKYTYGKFMVEAFKWNRRVFPHAYRTWHNPLGHLSPCDGKEYETLPDGMTSEEAWRACGAVGCDGMSFQTYPLNIEIPKHGTDPVLSHIDQLAYDAWDMSRRFRGDASPWGPPILSVDGTPLKIDYIEGMGYYLYNQKNGFDQATAVQWSARARTVEGVRFALDGAPR